MAQPDARLASDVAELKMLVAGLATNALRTQAQASPSPPRQPPADAPSFSRPAPAQNGELLHLPVQLRWDADCSVQLALALTPLQRSKLHCRTSN